MVRFFLSSSTASTPPDVTAISLVFGHALSVLSSFFSSSYANAALVFSNDFKADFRFTVVDGPLAGLGVGTILDFDAVGH